MKHALPRFGSVALLALACGPEPGASSSQTGTATVSADTSQTGTSALTASDGAASSGSSTGDAQTAATGTASSADTTSSDTGTSGLPAGDLEDCGNGELDPGEDCDDGNHVDYDACPWNCRNRPLSRLAVGERHVCVARGTDVRCWGDGSDGRHGSGSISPACTASGSFDCSADSLCCIGDDELPTAGPVHTMPSPVVQIAAARNTCALLEDGRVSCWGPGYSGILGATAYAACGGGTDCGVDPSCCVGDDETAAQGITLDFLQPVVQVAVGSEHACVLLADASVRCWGAGTWGRLGYGDEFSLGDDEAIETLPAVPVGGDVVHISTGAISSCAAFSNGNAVCWGACEHPTGVNTTCLGQPGRPQQVEPIGDNEFPSTVPQIALEFDAAVLSSGTGSYHTCSLTALDARCWGDAIDGSVGHAGQSDNIPALQQMLALVLDGHSPGLVSVGKSHACVVDISDDGEEQVECWGRSQFGATGYGTTRNIGRVQSPFFYGSVDVPPAYVVGTGDELTCAVTLDEEVYCWGAAAGPSGVDGALGLPGSDNIGDDEAPSSAGPVAVW